jgi:hypothetical protein
MLLEVETDIAEVDEKETLSKTPPPSQSVVEAKFKLCPG